MEQIGIISISDDSDIKDVFSPQKKPKMHKQVILHWKQVELSESHMILRLTLAEENVTATFPITSVFFLCLMWLSGMSGWSIRAVAGGGKSRCTISAINCTFLC